MQAEKFTNHEVADNLDSSEAFEGPEKTLRVYFATSANADQGNSTGLLGIPRGQWESMLELVKCKVLSVLVHPKVHAYVLSESSLFVYPDQVVLKTCGTTTLLAGIPAIINIVREFTQNHDETGVSPFVTAAFYSRRSYFNPEKQCHPHGSWDAEVSQLKDIFKGQTFSSHFGVNRDERWHLFTHSASPLCTSATQQLTEQQQVRVHDGWVELMMTGLNPALSSRFHIDASQPNGSGVGGGAAQNLEDSVLSLDSFTSVASAVGAEPDDDDPGHHIGNIMTRVTGIDQLFNSDRQCIDSFAFTPCGYSCNGILLDDGKYFTIHVTPEREFSYASFETNVEDPSAIEEGLTHQKLIDRVLELFEPAKLTLVLCLRGDQCFDPTRLSSSSYCCTSEAEFDIGNSTVLQVTLQKSA